MTTTQSYPVRITSAKGTAAQVVHFGSQFGPECGAGFNRQGGVPTMVRAEGPVTCTRKACAKHAG